MIRTSSIGDIIFSLPFVLAIKNTYPSCEITWLVDKRFEQLVQSDHLINKVISWQKDEWLALLSKRKYFLLFKIFCGFIKNLRTVKYDLVIDLQGLLRTNIFTKCCAAKKRISLGSEFFGSFFVDTVLPRDHSSRRISSEYFKLAKSLKLNYKDFLPRFDFPDEYLLTVESRFKPLKSKNFFVIAPFTTRPEKHWLNNHWINLVDLLIHKYQLRCIVLGKVENYEQKMLISTLEEKTTSLVGKTSLIEAAGIIKLAQFFIGVDTGLTHMSVSLKKKTIALFGSTCPYLNPVYSTSKVIWLNQKCSPCVRYPNIKSNLSCLNGIHPEIVENEIEKLIMSN